MDIFKPVAKMTPEELREKLAWQEDLLGKQSQLICDLQTKEHTRQQAETIRKWKDKYHARGWKAWLWTVLPRQKEPENAYRAIDLMLKRMGV